MPGPDSSTSTPPSGDQDHDGHHGPDPGAHRQAMHGGHSHGSRGAVGVDGLRSGRVVVAVSAVLVAVIAVSVAVGLVVLWPPSGPASTAAGAGLVPPGGAPLSQAQDGTVRDVQPFDCGGGQGVDGDGNPVPAGPCARVDVELDTGVHVSVDASQVIYRSGIAPGDRVSVLRGPGVPADPSGPGAVDDGGAGSAAGDDGEIGAVVPGYQFVDYQRGAPLALLTAVLLVLVLAVARWRGAAAVAGAAISLLGVVGFVVPALLAGRDALGVAVVGSSAVVLVVLYLAHGISVRTTAALLGTLLGLAVTALLGVWATGAAHLTGAAGEDGVSLAALAPQVPLQGVVVASMVIAGLGVLNDVTVTQSSLVWELRGYDRRAGRARLFAAAMRVGRDHIASSIYTLVFAYAGSALTVLLLVSVYARPLLDVATTDEIGTEIARTLVGSIGLVLAIPITTAIATLMAPPPRPSPAGPPPEPGATAQEATASS